MDGIAFIFNFWLSQLWNRELIFNIFLNSFTDHLVTWLFADGWCKLVDRISILPPKMDKIDLANLSTTLQIRLFGMIKIPNRLHTTIHY